MMLLAVELINMAKHNIGDVWTDKRGEVQIKKESGTMSLYRALVEDFIGCKIPVGFTVHHLDFNHHNNDLSNLMLLPTPLHCWLHRVNGTKDLFVSNLEKIKNNGFGGIE